MLEVSILVRKDTFPTIMLQNAMPQVIKSKWLVMAVW